MSKLYQCPYDKATKCDLKEPCLGCESLKNEIIEAKPKTYTVTVICWDGVTYTREADKKEIDMHRKNGCVKTSGYNGITFDFR